MLRLPTTSALRRFRCGTLVTSRSSTRELLPLVSFQRVSVTEFHSSSVALKGRHGGASASDYKPRAPSKRQRQRRAELLETYNKKKEAKDTVRRRVAQPLDQVDFDGIINESNSLIQPAMDDLISLTAPNTLLTGLERSDLPPTQLLASHGIPFIPLLGTEYRVEAMNNYFTALQAAGESGQSRLAAIESSTPLQLRSSERDSGMKEENVQRIIGGSALNRRDRNALIESMTAEENHKSWEADKSFACHATAALAITQPDTDLYSSVEGLGINAWLVRLAMDKRWEHLESVLSEAIPAPAIVHLEPAQVEGRVAVELSSFEALMTECLRQKEYKRVLKLFDQLVALDFVPTLSTWTKHVSALAMSGDIQEAKNVISRLATLGLPGPGSIGVRDKQFKGGMSPQLHNAVLLALLEQRKYKDMDKWWQDMHGEPGMVLNHESFQMMISRCANTGDPERARFYYDELITYGLKPDNAMFVSLLRSAAVAPYWVSGYEDSILEVCELMTTSGIVPDMTIYNEIMSAYSSAGDAVAAEYYYWEAKRKGLKPNPRTFEILLTAYANSQSVGASAYGSKGRHTLAVNGAAIAKKHMAQMARDPEYRKDVAFHTAVHRIGAVRAQQIMSSGISSETVLTKGGRRSKPVMTDMADESDFAAEALTDSVLLEAQTHPLRDARTAPLVTDILEAHAAGKKPSEILGTGKKNTPTTSALPGGKLKSLPGVKSLPIAETVSDDEEEEDDEFEYDDEDDEDEEERVLTDDRDETYLQAVTGDLENDTELAAHARRVLGNATVDRLLRDQKWDREHLSKAEKELSAAGMLDGDSESDWEGEGELPPVAFGDDDDDEEEDYDDEDEDENFTVPMGSLGAASAVHTPLDDASLGLSPGVMDSIRGDENTLNFIESLRQEMSDNELLTACRTRFTEARYQELVVRLTHRRLRDQSEAGSFQDVFRALPGCRGLLKERLDLLAEQDAQIAQQSLTGSSTLALGTGSYGPGSFEAVQADLAQKTAQLAAQQSMFDFFDNLDTSATNSPAAPSGSLANIESKNTDIDGLGTLRDRRHEVDVITDIMEYGRPPPESHTIIPLSQRRRVNKARAVAMLTEMRAEGYEADERIWSRLLAVFAEAQDIQNTNATLEEMKANGIAHTKESYEALIKMGVRNKDINSALTYYDEAKTAGIVPTVATYGFLVSSLGRRDMLVEALKTLEDAADNGVNIPERFLTHLRRRCDSVGITHPNLPADPHKWIKDVKENRRRLKTSSRSRVQRASSYLW